ncbi:galectin-3-like isoform X2 [Brienomyrus brachyistius]|uniref:galectin-3-like isoform X1 n=1 Tax=Brienomyrus brachyistius TaxID=42636 RepID=UPI0020B3FA31|nr:galectin-3-like isoform X1 [Brienomyrus brachyistius]XP_048830487.1 galectin-3-like isoform X2 [Brienomyrus brachyistius]
MDLSDALGDEASSGQQLNTQAGGPAWPGQPGQPAWPGQPGQPAWPGQPGQPNQPAWPGQPGQSAWPGQPGQPTWPGQPGQPNQPAWPGQPGQPNQPAWPGQPGQPIPSAPQPFSSGPLTVPYDTTLPRGCYDKMLISISGQIHPNANMFAINLGRGNDIALHINPRFNEEGRQVIVRNHLQGGNWGKEERECGSFPFVRGKPFVMKILCTNNEFRVAVNNSHLLEFKHKIRELSSVNHLNIIKDVTLTSVTVETLP